MRSSAVFILGALAICSSLGAASGARAERPLRMFSTQAGQIRVDGQLGEWERGDFDRLGQSPDGSIEYALASDGEALYLGARVWDDRLVRSSAPSPGEDAVVLVLALPLRDGAVSRRELWLYAGVAGKSAASAAIGERRGRLRKAPDIRVVEGPIDGEAGYVLEARIPLSLIPGASELQIARAALRLSDVDRREQRPRVLTSHSGEGSEPPLRFGANAALAGFMRDKSIVHPDHDLVADVLGGERLERLVVAGTMVVVVGPEVQDGKGFHYTELPVQGAGELGEIALRDVTGDRKAELLLSLRGEPPEVRRLSWNGERFVRLPGPESSQVAVSQAPAAAHPLRRPRTKPPADSSSGAGAVHPPPPGVDALVAAFRRDRGIAPAARPRFVRHVDLAEDGRIESLMLFDARLLVVGEGFRNGTGYFFAELPVASPGDVQRVFTGDVTGDGRREIFVRHKQVVQDVQREILLGYTFHGGRFNQILAVEVRRARGRDCIGNIVRLRRSGGHFALEISPGVAHGWTERSYPFVAQSSGDYAPLLLPWQDRAVQYRFDSGQLTAFR